MKVGRLVVLLLLGAVLLLGSEHIDYVFWKTLAHELGFAVLVAAVIWGMFEGQLRQEAEEIWDRRIEQATRNVFQAVLRKDLPKGLLDEAKNLVLDSPLVRSDFAVTYTLSDASFRSDPGRCTECVLVDALLEFSMKNVSTQDVSWDSGVRLPNPIDPGMKSAVKVHRFDVSKGGEPVQLDRETADAAFQRDLADNKLIAISYDPGLVVLKPGESCWCSANYTMAKEIEDSELLLTLQPADGVRVTVFDQAGDGRRIVLARSVHRGDLQIDRGPAKAASAQVFRIPAYLLPHQGVLIWWKRNPDWPTASVPTLPDGLADGTPERIEGAGNDQHETR